ncbi:MAG: hypothetical protein WCJ42_12005 [Actinomycetes bacterium]
MGRLRRKSVRVATPELLAAAMPAEVNLLEFCGTTEGLKSEMERIRAWIDEQVPGRGDDLLAPVLEHVGFNHAQWYRRVLTGG